jgi:plasmid maintenance system antidote protein VapI
LTKFDYGAMKSFIDEVGLKQRAISERSGVPEVRLCLILGGKARCTIDEYANLCDSLGVGYTRFLRKESKSNAPAKT